MCIRDSSTSTTVPALLHEHGAAISAVFMRQVSSWSWRRLFHAGTKVLYTHQERWFLASFAIVETAVSSVSVWRSFASSIYVVILDNLDRHTPDKKAESDVPYESCSFHRPIHPARSSWSNRLSSPPWPRSRKRCFITQLLRDTGAPMYTSIFITDPEWFESRLSVDSSLYASVSDSSGGVGNKINIEDVHIRN